MSNIELKDRAWPPCCAICDQSGPLVLCQDCGWEMHITCAEVHDCPCPYCSRHDCWGECEKAEGYYDGDKWRRE